MKMRHVALVIRWPTGGIRTYLKYVYPTVLAQGWRVTIVMPEGGGAELVQSDLGGANCQFLLVPERKAKRHLASAAWKMISADRPAVIHSHGLTAALISSSVSSIRGVPHLVTLHDVFQERQFAGAKGMLKRKVVARLLGSASQIQTVTEDARQNLLSFLPTLNEKGTDSIYVVPNGIKADQFSQANARDIRSELNLGPDVFMIGFLGRFMNQKGFRVLIDAIGLLVKRGSLPRIPLVVAFGGGGFVREDSKLLRSRGLEQYFQFMPFVPDVAGTLKGLDVVAMPSLWEAAGILAMESMAAGVPLIATSCIGLREVVENTCATVVHPGKCDELAMALLSHMESPDLHKRKAQSYAALAQVRFDVRASSGRVLQAIEEIAIASRRTNELQ